MMLLLDVAIPTILTSLCAYSYGVIRANENFIKERKGLNAWCCPGCNMTARIPDNEVIEGLVFAWKVHDETTNCSYRWTVEI